MGLGHLATDWAAADDDQVVGQDGVFEHCFVGHVRHVGEAGDRRDRGATAGCDNEAAGLDHLAASLDRIASGELRLGLDHGAAEAGEAFDRVMRCDRRDHVVDVSVGFLEVDLRRSRIDAELA